MGIWSAGDQASRAEMNVFIVTADDAAPTPTALQELAATDAFPQLAVSLIDHSPYGHHLSLSDQIPWLRVLRPEQTGLSVGLDESMALAMDNTTAPFVMLTNPTLRGQLGMGRAIERGGILAERFGLLDAPFPLLAPSSWSEHAQTVAFRAWIAKHHPDYVDSHQFGVDAYLHMLPFRNMAASVHGLDVVEDGTVLRITGTCRRGATDTVEPPDQHVRLVLTDDNGEIGHVLDTQAAKRMESGEVRWTGFTAEVAIDQLPLGKSTLDIELGAPEGFDDVRVPVKTSVGMLAASRPIVAGGRRFQAFPVHGSDRVELVVKKATSSLSRLGWAVTVARRDFGALVHRRPFAWVRIARTLTRPLTLGGAIWLVGERPDTARDNGYHLFAHLSREHPDVRAYYVITSSSDQFAQMSALGRVVRHSSWRHRLLMLHTTVLINAYSIKHMVPRQWNLGFYMRHFTWRVGSYRVYLKHGIHMDTKVIKRGVTGYDLFLTATPGETAAARETSGYGRQITETGLPRYDALVPTPHSRTILFMPTWRLYFAESLFGGKREPTLPFEHSTYQRFMYDFLSSSRLSDLLKRHDYRLQFMPHYNMRGHLAGVPVSSDRIDVLDGAAANIQDVMRACDLFVTDHSSVHFDLAYLGTPLVYAHFDDDEYRAGHANESWFDHERDGFGPVSYDLDSMLDAIEHYLSTGCEREDVYGRRADEAFAFHDRNNSKRAVEAIEDLIRTHGAR